tara:strand:- start:16896 stop:17081 length:186 start_codon:yes stop_codon:yes gene_type:complete
MSLDKATLVQAIKDIRNIDTSNGGIENDDLANALADAIEVFVGSGDVVVNTGSSAGTYKVT